MGFFSAPRRLSPTELDLGSGFEPLPVDGPVEARAVFPPAVAQPGPDQPADALPFTQQPIVALDPIFGTPVAELDPWMTAPAPEEKAADLGPSIDVEVLGNGYQVNGTLTTGRFDRLSDWLNMQQGWVNVQDGRLFRPGHEDTSADKPATSQWVRLNQIVLVAERQAVQRDRSGKPIVRKQRKRVTIVTQDYLLRGHIHLVANGSMQQFLESPDPHFLPMTDVTVRWLLDETIVSHYQFALVNRGQLISVSEEAARDDAEAAAAAESAEPAEELPAFLRSA